jgi:TolA-binding protein
MRKILFAVLLLSVLTACSKQASQPVASGTPQPVISQESKHGYDLAKTWDEATEKEKDAEADAYYTSRFTRFGKTDSQLAHLELDLTTYEVCVNEAMQETACKTLSELPAYQTPETRKACADAGELGPKHRVQCDKLIDELPTLIEKQNAALKEELKR